MHISDIPFFNRLRHAVKKMFVSQIYIDIYKTRMYSNTNIILYHSIVINKIDKKYDYEFKDLLRYYKKYTKKLFNEFDYKKENLFKIQTMNVILNILII